MPQDEMVAFGEKLKEYRKQKGLTQEELAALVGVQNSAISKYEKGRIKQIPIHILERLRAVLEFNVNDIPDSQIVFNIYKKLRPAYLPEQYKSRLRLTEAYLRLLFYAPNPRGENSSVAYFDHFYINGDNFLIIAKNHFSENEVQQIQDYIDFVINKHIKQNPSPF